MWCYLTEVGSKKKKEVGYWKFGDFVLHTSYFLLRVTINEA